MANPQIEKGYIRIANELWDEILRRNFTKRQQNLVLFIWRMSYGTGQKDCKIDKFSDFQLAGLYKQDVKKELKYLRDCAVLEWNEESMIFSINKNYKLWQVSPNKNWDSERFKALIHKNITRNKTEKTKKSPKKKVSKTLTYKSKRVSKSLTTKLVKYLPSSDRKSVVISDPSSLKTLLKTLYIKDIKEEEPGDPVINYLVKNEIVPPGGVNQTIRDDLADIEEFFGFDNPNEMILEAIKDAVRGNGRTWKFIYNKLNLWRAHGVRNKKDLIEYEARMNKTIPFRKKRIPKYDPNVDAF